MSVLGVCYSIHQGKSTRHYTLQRFNCYFFCWNIMLILSRRLVTWERTFCSSLWLQTVNGAVNSLSQLAQTPTSPGGKQRLLFRVFSWLNNESAQPSQFIFDELRQILLQEGTRCTLNDLLSGQVWLRFSEFSDVSHWLRGIVWSTVPGTLKANSSTVAALLAISSPDMDEPTDPELDDTIRNLCKKECLGAPSRVSHYVEHIYTSGQQISFRRKQFDSFRKAAYYIPMFLVGAVLVCGFTPSGIPDISGLVDGLPAHSPRAMRSVSCLGRCKVEVLYLAGRGQLGIIAHTS
jgi:hypothetical protein